MSAPWKNDRLAIVVSSREDASFLAKAGTSVPMGTDLSLALSNWARLSVPYLADWCMIDLLMPNAVLKRLATAFRFPEGEYQSRLFKAERHLESLPSGLVQLISGNHPYLEDPASTEWIVSYFSVIKPTGALIMPLKISGKPAGVITWLMAGSGRSFAQDRIGVAEEFAARVASSLENLNAYRISQNAVRSREEFISLASHELKTPLTVLKLQLQLLQQKLPEDEQAVVPVNPLRRSLTAIQKATDRLGETIHRLLDLTQIRSGQLTLSCNSVDLREIVREVCGPLAPALERAECELRLDLGEETRGSWDRFRLGQVITNLISNAAKYAPGSPIVVSLGESAGYATLSVTDHGKGIALVDQDRIFEPYARARDVRKESGMGLGLYICRNIVELHGGRIWVESRVGEGAKFSIQLPIDI